MRCRGPLGWVCVALLAINCADPEPPARGPAAAVARSVFVARELDQTAMEKVLAEALADRAEPVAAVVLGVSDRRLLGLGRHRGADPAARAFRPGSSVKPLVAWIGAHQAEPLALPNDTIDCKRVYAATAPELTCFDQHGPLGLPDAIAVSCNVYFYELGRRLGSARVASGLSELGFGKRTGLVPAEVSGRLERDGRAELVATGHGPFEATLLQLAAAYVTLAHELADSTNELDAQIADGLVRVVSAEHGTGRLAAVDGVAVAGKTGTAEAEPYGAEVEAGSQKENGWFVGWAPAEKPEIVVAVVALESESGGKSAAPIAGRIFRALLRPK